MKVFESYGCSLCIARSLIGQIFMCLDLIGWKRHLSSINLKICMSVIVSTDIRRKNISHLACKYVSLINNVVQSIVPDLEQMLDLHQKIFDLNEVELEKMKPVHRSDLPMTCQIHSTDNFKGLGFPRWTFILVWNWSVHESLVKRYIIWSRKLLEMKLVFGTFQTC